MPITRTPILDDDGTGTSGTSIDNAWKQQFYDQIDALVGPLATTWQAVPFSAANFSATAPMTWTVGAPAVIRNRYTVMGKTLFWSMYLSWFSGSNVLGGSAGNTLNLTLPGGYQAGDQSNLIAFSAGVTGAPQLAGLYTTVTGPKIGILKSGNVNFALADTPGFITTFILEVA